MGEVDLIRLVRLKLVDEAQGVVSMLALHVSQVLMSDWHVERIFVRVVTL